MTINKTLLSMTVAALLATPYASAEVVTAQQSASGISWSTDVAHGGAVLSIHGPDDFSQTTNYRRGEALEFSFSQLLGGFLPDGLYSYELTVAPRVTSNQATDLQVARDLSLDAGSNSGLNLPTPFPVTSGSFSVVAGAVQNASQAEPVPADQVFLDDLIVDGSACVGMDCVNGENFGFDTLRIKENNLRFHFDDTSSSGSFPTNDWRLIANDTNNGGASYLAIEDSTAGNVPFRVEAGAGANTLVVDSNRRIGVGTINPSVKMHMVDGNTPTLRLEQDGSSGFTAQTYDVAANEANFFIRDVTNGSRLFFRAKPGAPADSIFIAANGDIGFGTDSPGTVGSAAFNTNAAMHIKRSVSAGLLVEDTGTDPEFAYMFELQNTGGGGLAFRLEDGANGIDFNNTGGEFRINFDDGDNQELALTADGNLTIDGSITTSGMTCGSGCDLVFEAGYDLPSIEQHSSDMWSLGYLPNVGPTIENQPYNMTDKLGRMLNELEKAHIYIDQLHERLEILEASID